MTAKERKRLEAMRDRLEAMKVKLEGIKAAPEAKPAEYRHREAA